MTRYPYQGSRWRLFAAWARVIVVAMLGTFLLAPLTLTAFLDPSVPLLLGVAALFALTLVVWQTFLAVGSNQATTADLSLDGASIRLGDHLAINRYKVTEGFEVVYRLGQPERTPGPLLRPRRRFRRAIFVPVEAVRHGPVWPLWACARMYAGGAARLGFLITPDHAGHHDLLAALGQPDLEPEAS